MALPPDRQPMEADVVLIKGFIPGDSPDAPLVPTTIRVPADHPILRQVRASQDDYSRYSPLLRDHQQDDHSQTLSHAVAEHARRQAEAAEEHLRVALPIVLESLRQQMTVAVQEKLRAYFGECQRNDRRPLTWDSASFAVGAVIETLRKEWT